MEILSPAKINLMLRILGTREDGYHLLQTYFQLLNWGDMMNFTELAADKVIIEGEFRGLATKDNLIYKAAQLLIPLRNQQHGVKIEVTKNIPQGSGLGGGSSNAATALIALNKIWQCQLSQEQLQQLALKLGADVPVFVLQKSAMATGIGEQLTAYTISNYHYVLIFPKTSISTADVFADKNLNRSQLPIELQNIKDKNTWTNACLAVVLTHYPEVRHIYNRCSVHEKIYLSGTGSTLFACFKDENSADNFIAQHANIAQMIKCRAKC